jgi:hypothetical protein
MSYATRTYLSHTVFWHVLENNSVNQGCFEFDRNILLAILKETFITHHTQEGQQGG